MPAIPNAKTTMATRHNVLIGAVATGLTPLAATGTAAPTAAAQQKIILCMHSNTSAAAGYRRALEGWAKAGIKNVELNAAFVDDFVKTDTLAGARKVLADN